MKMSKVKWTDEQQNAITKKGSNILVAAAAGSRKNSCFSRKNNWKNNIRKLLHKLAKIDMEISLYKKLFNTNYYQNYLYIITA